jgi:hypothetical protein
MTNEKHDIYKSFQMLNGTKCDILMASLGDMSMAMFEFTLAKQKNDNPYDLIFYIIKRVCLFNGKKETSEFIANLPGECYMQIQVLLDGLLSPNF